MVVQLKCTNMGDFDEKTLRMLALGILLVGMNIWMFWKMG